MPKLLYALEPGGPKNLVLSWGAFWKNFKVTLDDKLIGEASSQQELSRGKAFALPDGSSLEVKLKTNFGVVGPTLKVSRNGKPLPGRQGDLLQNINTARWLLFLLGGINAVFGFVYTEGRLYSISYGAILLALGYLTPNYAKITLLLGMLALLVDAALVVVFSVQTSTVNPTFFIFRFLLLYFLYSGFSAARKLPEA